MKTVKINYRGFVIEQMGRGCWMLRRPGSWLECMWCKRASEPLTIKETVDRWHHVQNGGQGCICNL